jgi:hypothetical protein
VSYLTGPRTGILTFHRCINYGSYWQAKCLAEGLQARGNDATILDHHSRRVNLIEWRCAYQPLLPIQTPAADIPLYRNKIERFFRAFESLPLSSRFSLDDSQGMEHYDMIVVGSDEVWNLFHPWYGKHPLFFGEGLRTNRLISYAASFGNYPSSIGLGQEWSSRLLGFDAISVRDENSFLLIKNAMDIDPAIVLDPCLQFPINTEERIYHHFSKPYLAVYGHNFSEQYVRLVRQWASKKELRLISIGYRNDWADEQWIDADPHDFSHFIAGAEAVATNFFHGCVFSIRHGKPFACESSQYRSYKVQNLLKKLDGEQHLITEETPFADVDAILSSPPGELIYQNIDYYRQRSNDFLDRALGVQELRVA